MRQAHIKVPRCGHSHKVWLRCTPNDSGAIPWLVVSYDGMENCPHRVLKSVFLDPPMGTITDRARRGEARRGEARRGDRRVRAGHLDQPAGVARVSRPVGPPGEVAPGNAIAHTTINRKPRRPGTVATQSHVRTTDLDRCRLRGRPHGRSCSTRGCECSAFDILQIRAGSGLGGHSSQDEDIGEEPDKGHRPNANPKGGGRR